LGHGDFGDSKSLGQGLHELRLKVGPGFRVYYGSEGGRVVVLPGGGTKRTPARDIERALKRWQEWTG
ncbi:MAG: type II toxin-antitoxin system RelE/ParE family toxin, partial [SAR324 cluster bacterium]|nr:type II toxin-antitoxin system RelE/ParE family toxin [SAR324 cluster bacterium]